MFKFSFRILAIRSEAHPEMTEAEKTHSYKKETALTQPRVAIVGGGFGGLYAARALAGAPVSVTLIDKRNYHLFSPMLYQCGDRLVIGRRNFRAPEKHADVKKVRIPRLQGLDPGEIAFDDSPFRLDKSLK
jgi:NADPH-dependent 2,4-dienoyl-CoA reductase/sulfur reductase-like enzyme